MKLKSLFRNLFCLFSLILGGCGEKENDPNAPYIVMTSPDNPPFEYTDTSTGSEKIVGFDMDLIQKIADHLHWNIKIVPADFPALLPALQSGRADMVIATMTPTPERAKSVSFSAPYYQNSFAFLMRKETNITSPKELAQKKLGVQMGSTHEQVAEQFKNETQDLSIVSLARIGDLVQELKTGRVDAVLLERYSAQKIAANNPELVVVALQGIAAESPAIAFPKDSPLVDDVDDAIEELKKNGVIDALAKTWFHDKS